MLSLAATGLQNFSYVALSNSGNSFKMEQIGFVKILKDIFFPILKNNNILAILDFLTLAVSWSGNAL